MGGRRGYLVAEGRDLSGRPRRGGRRTGARARMGPRGRRHDRCGPTARCAWWASRSRRTTSPTRSRAPRGCTCADVYGDDTARPTSRCCGSTTAATPTSRSTQARAVSFGLGRPDVRDPRGRAGAARPGGRDRHRAARARSRSWRSCAAGTMLAAGAHAEVQRRLRALGVQRALGLHAGPDRRAAGRARPRSSPCRPPRPGIAAGALAVAGPSAGLLAALNELPAGRGAARPARPGAGRRGGDRRGRRHVARLARGAAAAGDDPARRRRVATRRRARRPRRPRARSAPRLRRPRLAGGWVAAVATVGVCAGVVTLHARARLAARAAARRPRHGRQALPADRRRSTPALADDRRARSPASPAAAPRYAVDGADCLPRSASRCGSSPSRATTRASRRRRWPTGRRMRGPGEVEVGLGLADALGLRPGSTLAVAARRRHRGALPRRRRRARARERRPDRAGSQPDAPARGRPGPRAPRSPIRLDAGRRPRRASTARLRALGAPPRRSPAPRPATPRSSACSPPCCGASGWRSGSSACTRSSRRSP